MPPKRKRITIEQSEDNRTTKRPKISSESVDTSVNTTKYELVTTANKIILYLQFQYLNEDIPKIIIDFLTNSLPDLVNLSLTASSWHGRINNFLNQSIKKFMPVSYKNLSISERNTKCGGFFKALNNTHEIQLFSYKLASSNPYGNTLNVVPWDHNIVVQTNETCIRVLDLTKDVEVLSIEIDGYLEEQTHISFNEKRTY